MQHTLRGKGTSREGAGSLPAFLLDETKEGEERNEVALRRRVAVCCSLPKDLELLPGQLPVTSQERLTEETPEEREASCRW